MADSNINGDSDGDRVSDDEFAEAEHLARRALERNKDDEEARRLWKLSRRGQGKSLGSDLPETLRKEIYAEHALAVERRLYLTHDLTARLQQAENPHDLVNASIENASDEARNFIVSKYAITSFELDLILHEGEKESWPVKAMNSADDSAAMEESPVLPKNEVIKDAGTPPSQDRELSPETLGAIFLALSSKDVKEGDTLEIKQDGTVGVNTGGLGLTEYDIVQLYQHGIRKVGGIELTRGVYDMAQTALELGAEPELSDFAADLIRQREQKQARKQKKKPIKEAAPKKAYVPRKRKPVEMWQLVLVPTVIALVLNLSGLFLLQLSMRPYMLLNGALIVAIGIYSAVRLDWAGEWPTKRKSDNPREELAGCVGGLLVIGLVLAVLGGALKLGNTIMLPIVFASLCIYGLFQFVVYPKLFKSLVLFTGISKLPELAGSLLISTGTQNSPVRPSNILALSVVMPIYATWVGMITAGLLDWRRERKRGASPRASDTETEIDRTSPTYLYSLAVSRIQSAPKEVSQEELQDYYLDVCRLFEQAIELDTNRPELDKEAYKKVAFTCGALYRSLKKHEDALRLFSVGLKHHSRDPELLAGVGWSQFDLGKISDAEKTASQLLEVAPDSDDGRQLWKAIRKALGQELTSDLTEDLKRRIYKEYLQERDRSFVQGYMESGVSSKLSFEELVSDISGKAGDAELKVRRLLLEKYGLKEFEFDLIVKQGEREAWNED